MWLTRLQKADVTAVRLLARILFWAGWVALAGGLIGFVAQLLVAFSSPPFGGYSSLAPGSFMPQPTIMMLASAVYFLLMPLGFFFAWGVLSVLCEMHDRLEEQVLLMAGSEDPGTTD